MYYPENRRTLGIQDEGAERPMRSKDLTRECGQESSGFFCNITQGITLFICYIRWDLRM